MNIIKKTTYTMKFTQEEISVLFTAYNIDYPACDFAWFLRQVLHQEIEQKTLVRWLESLTSALGHSEKCLSIADTIIREVRNTIPNNEKGLIEIKNNGKIED